MTAPEFGKISASCPAEGITTILVPGWPQTPQPIARTDGLDEITFVIAKCHPDEACKWVRLRHDVAVPICYLTKTPLAKVQRTDYNTILLVPPARLETIQVAT